MEAALQWAAARGETDLATWITWWIDGVPPHNVWVVTSVENQAMADLRIPLLCKIPAKVRGLSCEPMLERIDLKLYQSEGGPTDAEPFRERGDLLCWIICGCESGPRRRPVDLESIRNLRDQCNSAAIPFFLKQMEVAGQMIKMPLLDGSRHGAFPAAF